jgi:uncharacterized membrane protein
VDSASGTREADGPQRLPRVAVVGQHGRLPGSLRMRKPLKFIHTVATAVLVGALALQLVIAYRYVGLSPADAATIEVRQLMATVARWITTPSMAVVVVSGLLLMGLNNTFNSAGWVWAKALIGLMLVKGVITLVDPAAREIATMAARGIAAGDAEALGELARLVRMERGGAWVALLLCLGAIGLGVWRPRFSSASRATEPATGEAEGGEPGPPPSRVGPHPRAAASVPAQVR